MSNEERIAQLPDLLRPELIHAWLTALPAESIVGTACRARECPVQHYLEAVLPAAPEGCWLVGISEIVFVDDVGFGHTYRFNDETDWIVEFIGDIDCSVPLGAFWSVTREQALDRLAPFL